MITREYASFINLFEFGLSHKALEVGPVDPELLPDLVRGQAPRLDVAVNSHDVDLEQVCHVLSRKKLCISAVFHVLDFTLLLLTTQPVLK